MKITGDLKNMWQYFLPFKRKIALIIVLATAMAAISAAIPYLYGLLVDLAIKKAGLFFIFKILLAWLGLSLFNDWLSRQHGQRTIVLSTEISNLAINKFLKHIINLPISFHKNEKIGKVMNRANRVAWDIAYVVNTVVASTFPGILTTLIILIVLFFLHWYLTLILAVVLVLYFFATIFKTREVVACHRKMNKVFDSVFSDFWEFAYNVQLIKSFSAEKSIFKKITWNLLKITNQTRNNALAWKRVEFWQQLIFGVGFVVLFSIGIWLLHLGKITAGNLVTFVGYIALVYRPLAQIAENYQIIRRALTLMEKVEKIKARKTEKEERGADLIQLKNLQGKVEFQNVSFRYAGKGQPIVVKDVNFSVAPGESVAFVGKSGEGKTTLADLINCFFIPTRGKILIDGVPTNKLDPETFRSFTAVVPQEVVLFHDTIWYNLQFANPGATKAEMVEAAKMANAHRFIMKFPKGYDSKVGDRGVKLSTGQKQRVAIARAILHNPKILILDEATASLDSVTEKLVQTALQKLIAGRTTFIIAHRLSTVQNVDKIIVLDSGEVAQIGRHEDLIKEDGVYRRLYQAQRF